MPKQRLAAVVSDLSNRQLILLALLLQGGASKFVDIEDIAVEAYRLAPTRFRWNRYDYPSLEGARVAFKHWKDKRDEEPRFTSDRLSYSLTAIGVREATETGRHLLNRSFANAEALVEYYQQAILSTDGPKFKSALSHKTVTNARPAQQELRRIRSHKLYKSWRRGDGDFEPWEIADLLNCLPNSSERVWEERFNRLSALAASSQDDEFTEFLAVLKRRIAVTE